LQTVLMGRRLGLIVWVRIQDGTWAGPLLQHGPAN